MPGQNGVQSNYKRDTIFWNLDVFDGGELEFDRQNGLKYCIRVIRMERAQRDPLHRWLEDSYKNKHACPMLSKAWTSC